MSDQSTGDLHILRLGYQDRANYLPLLHAIKAGWVGPDSPWKIEAVNGTPAQIAGALMAGELDAAFVTPLLVQQEVARLAPLGGWGLACEGPVQTAMLLAPRRIDLMDGGEVTITPDAYGSSADYLLRILLKPYYDVELTLREPGEPEAGKEAGRLLYGDEAARETQRKPEGWVADDLGVAWFVLSGLPMVWEMLVAHRDLQERKPGAGEAIGEALRRSARAGQEQQTTILAEASQRLGTDQQKAIELFARQKYTLGTNEQKGLGRFLDMAGRAGLASR